MPQSRHPSLRHSDGPALAVIVAAIVCVGAGLRLWQYLANASLWVDEAAVARNVVDRSVAGLFAPLDYGQAAPWGFLLIEKLAVALFGNHEYALRLFPLLCGLASLVLFYVVARQILTGVGVPVALTMFAIGIPFVYFPSQVKPYSCDIAAALLVAALALRLWRTRPPLHTALWFGAIGAAIPFVSYSSVFPLAGIGAAMVVLAWHDRRPLPPVLAAVGLWCAGVVLAIGAARGSMTAADREFMHRYWAAGFAPAPHSLQDWLWPWHQITAAFGVFSKAPPTLDGGLHYRYPLLCAALCLAGAWSLLRRGRHLAAFVFAPAALAFIAAAAHAYPISGRLAVFLIPFLAIAVAAAIEDLHDAARPRVGYAALLAPTFVIVLAVHAIARTLPPDRQEDVKSVLSYVRDHRRPDDAVYVYYGAGQAVRYYASRYGFTADEYVSGSCARDDPRVYLREIDRFRGRPRAWAIFSHSLQDGREIRLMTGYLDRIGRRLDASPAQSGPLGAGAYAFLYDLTDANKLASASAESFSVPRADRETAWLCYGTMTPVRFVRTPNLEPRTSNLEPRTMNAEP